MSGRLTIFRGAHGPFVGYDDGSPGSTKGRAEAKVWFEQGHPMEGKALLLGAFVIPGFIHRIRHMHWLGSYGHLPETMADLVMGAGNFGDVEGPWVLTAESGRVGPAWVDGPVAVGCGERCHSFLPAGGPGRLVFPVEQWQESTDSWLKLVHLPPLLDPQVAWRCSVVAMTDHLSGRDPGVCQIRLDQLDLQAAVALVVLRTAFPTLEIILLRDNPAPKSQWKRLAQNLGMAYRTEASKKEQQLIRVSDLAREIPLRAAGVLADDLRARGSVIPAKL